MPDLYMNRDDNSSIDADSSFDDETISNCGYDYKSASDNELYGDDDESFTDDSYDDEMSCDDERFDNNSGWSREDRAQDREAAKVREDREQRLRLALIQDIYIREKHRRERKKYYTTPTPLQD